MTSIAENIEQVRENIALAEQRSGVESGSVCLCAVTKYVAEERIYEAVLSGITTVGENHAQEFSQKLNFYKQHGLHAHFIGQLQTNKVKYICGNAELIQSCDRIPLLRSIETFAEKHGVVQQVLIQVNIGEEPQKGGVMPEDLDGLLSEAEVLPHIIIRGLMCVPPALEPESVRPYFRQMRKIFEQKQNASRAIDTLSMGMSHDYVTAIEEGATMVRVGSAIFGARQIPGGLIHG